MYRDIPESLRALIEPVVEDHSCELVDVEVQRGSGPGLVRVTIDRRSGDGLVPVDCCAAVSRELGTVLDAADAVSGSYRLEVSSPGLNRVLGREKDFAAACGGVVKLRTRRPLDGRRRFRGKLLGFANGVARMDVDGTEVDVRFEDVEKANTIYEFSRGDFSRAAN